jgi:uncharacterized RDD family membrane protein YckC
MAQHSGWYEDPSDPTQLRYWDGVLWTANTVPKVSPTAHQSTIGLAAPGPQAPTGHGVEQPAYGEGQGQPPYSQPGYGQYSQPGQYPYPAAPGQVYAGGPWARAGKAAPDGTPLALWWQRLLARIIDSVLLSVVTFIVASPWIGPLLTTMEDYIREVMNAAQSGASPPSSLDFQAQITQYLLPIALISLVISLTYETVFLLWRGATIGKLILGIRVRRVGDAGSLGPVTALRRQVITAGVSIVALVPFVSTIGSMLTLLDDAWLLWDPRRQCLHDKIADTLVVKNR